MTCRDYRIKVVESSLNTSIEYVVGLKLVVVTTGHFLFYISLLYYIIHLVQTFVLTV